LPNDKAIGCIFAIFENRLKLKKNHAWQVREADCGQARKRILGAAGV
jgi:hypothetical protein